MMLSDEYMAGFFEGEGSARVYRRPNRSPDYQLVFTQRDRVVLDLIQKTLGVGRVYVNRAGTLHQLRIAAKQACRDVCLRLKPHLHHPDKIRDVRAMLAGKCVSTHPGRGRRRSRY